MKRVMLKRGLYLALGTMSVAALTGCGSSPAPAPTPVGAVPGATVGAPGGCIPLTAQIPFTGTNIYFDWANIVGGYVPQANQAIGTMVIGGAATGGPYQRNGVDGVISMNVTPVNTQQPGAPAPGMPYPGYPTGTTPIPSGYNMSPTMQASSLANVNGFVQISAQTQQDIAWRFGASMGYNPYGMPGTMPVPTQPGQPVPAPGQPYPTTGQQVCVSGIAMNVGHYYNTIYGGNVYLFLNNTQHGYALYF